MSILDQIISMDEAAELFGRERAAFTKAAQRGTLEAKRVTPRCYITTRELAAAYVARVQAGRPVRRPPGGIRPPSRYSPRDIAFRER